MSRSGNYVLMGRNSNLEFTSVKKIRKSAAFKSGTIHRSMVEATAVKLNDEEKKLIKKYFTKFYNNKKTRLHIPDRTYKILKHSAPQYNVAGKLIQKASVYMTVHVLLATKDPKRRLRLFYNLIVPERNKIYVNSRNAVKIIERLAVFDIKDVSQRVYPEANLLAVLKNRVPSNADIRRMVLNQSKRSTQLSSVSKPKSKPKSKSVGLFEEVDEYKIDPEDKLKIIRRTTTKRKSTLNRKSILKRESTRTSN